ncbi:putative mediator of RNA polymerase II transcription subunit 30-like [Capsicum annuum]|nr:putative mediator of RNA polymerase II transcription subunit 30-like [Capsicum annuum]
MTTPVKVYGPTLSTAVSRVLACFLEKDVKFELIPVNMAKGEHKKPDYFKIQANYGSFELRVYWKQPLDLTKIGFSFMMLILVLDGIWGLHCFTDAYTLAFAPRMKLKQDENLIRQNEEKLKKVLDVYEKRLGESQYLAGDEFTLADLSHFPNIQYLVNGTDRAELFTSRENVGRWWGEISSRESWKKENKYAHLYSTNDTLQQSVAKIEADLALVHKLQDKNEMDRAQLEVGLNTLWDVFVDCTILLLAWSEFFDGAHFHRHEHTRCGCQTLNMTEWAIKLCIWSLSLGFDISPIRAQSSSSDHWVDSWIIVTSDSGPVDGRLLQSELQIPV